MNSNTPIPSSVPAGPFDGSVSDSARQVRRRVPFQAFLIQAPRTHGFSDAFSVSAVIVTKLDHANQRAEVRKRVGSIFETKTVPFAELATDHAGVFQKIDSMLATIADRATRLNELVTPIDSDRPLTAAA